MTILQRTFAIVLGLFVVTAGQASAQQSIEHSGPFEHPFAKAVFPDRIGGYVREGITQHDAVGQDISANYKFENEHGTSRISVYVYPDAYTTSQSSLAARERACDQVFEEVHGEIADTGRYDNVRQLFRGRAAHRAGVNPRFTHWSAYGFSTPFLTGEDEEMRSEAVLYCGVEGGWFVKYRITSTMRIDGARALVRFQRDGPWPGRTGSTHGGHQSMHAAPSSDRYVSSVPRTALIVGAGSYDSLGSLPNAESDAKAVAQVLRSAGFSVELVINPSNEALWRAIDRFGKRMERSGAGGAGLFYYAGHGIQSEGQNFLIPVDASLSQEDDLSSEALSADVILAHMKAAGVSTNILILDACRNLPIGSGFSGNDQGLAQMNAPSGTFISYSTAPGDVAADGAGENSPFTMAFIREVSRSTETIEPIFRNVRRSVLTVTEGDQTPWDSSSLVEPFYFAQ